MQIHKHIVLAIFYLQISCYFFHFYLLFRNPLQRLQYTTTCPEKQYSDSELRFQTHLREQKINRKVVSFPAVIINQKLSLNITNKFFHFLAYLLLLIIMNIVSAIKFNNSCI